MKIFKRIEQDKWRHFYVGIGMGVVLQFFFEFLLPSNKGLAIGLAILITAVISYGFELFSKISGKGTYDLGDAWAGMIGGLIGIGVVVVM